MNTLQCCRLFLFLFSILSATPAAACIWTFGTRLDGSVAPIEEAHTLEEAVRDYLWQLGHNAERYKYYQDDSVRLAEKLLLEEEGDDTVMESREMIRNDYAVTLLRLGHFNDGLAMLLALERDHPGLYATASNIGTAYELLGRNHEALDWIREGIRRNPDSHNGSEWLHVRILEARIAMQSDSGWIRRNTVLGLDFGDGALPVKPVIPAGYPAGDRHLLIGQDLFYQLGERLLFTTPPDPLAADLLVDLGNTIVLDRGALQIAVAVYELALRYDAVRADLVRRRIAALKQIIAKHPPADDSNLVFTGNLNDPFPFVPKSDKQPGSDPEGHFWQQGPWIAAAAGGAILLLGGAVIGGRRWRKRRGANGG